MVLTKEDVKNYSCSLCSARGFPNHKPDSIDVERLCEAIKELKKEIDDIAYNHNKNCECSCQTELLILDKVDEVFGEVK